jgi:hypothetical protein
VFAAAAALIAFLRWRGLGVDATAALAATAAMLVYPLAWFQYDTTLIPVVAWVIARAAASGDRLAVWGLAIYLLFRTIPDMIPTPDGAGVADFLARNKGWLQVLARSILLVAVVAAMREHTGKPSDDRDQ